MMVSASMIGAGWYDIIGWGIISLCVLLLFVVGTREEVVEK